MFPITHYLRHRGGGRDTAQPGRFVSSRWVRVVNSTRSHARTFHFHAVDAAADNDTHHAESYIQHQLLSASRFYFF
jgi:hypothetical protein